MTSGTELTGPVVAWWQSLQPREHEGRLLTGDRAALARLRRARSIVELCTEPATIALCRQASNHPKDLERYALIAGVLAVVRADVPQSLARLLGEPEGNPRFSPLRLRRLIEAVEPDEQLTGFRQALAQVDHRANVRDLAATLLDWTPRSRFDQRRQRLIYEYYHVVLPHDVPSITESAA